MSETVDRAVKFLTNPKVKGQIAMKVSFLQHKGLTTTEIMQALNIASGGEITRGL